MIIKTEDLESVALDWAVAAATNSFSDGEEAALYAKIRFFAPSLKWEQGGPLVEKHIGLSMRDDDKDESGRFYAETWCGNMNAYANGATPLIAAMRAIVVAKLGEEVDVPGELL